MWIQVDPWSSESRALFSSVVIGILSRGFQVPCYHNKTLAKGVFVESGKRKCNL